MNGLLLSLAVIVFSGIPAAAQMGSGQGGGMMGGGWGWGMNSGGLILVIIVVLVILGAVAMNKRK